MHSPDIPVLQKVQMSHKTLKKTMFEKQADFTKDDAPGLDLDLKKTFEEGIKQETRES
jgi:hypothetical protein